MSDSELLINVATEFSAYPAGRDDGDGPFNGAKFRKDILEPRLRGAIAKNDVLVVSLDGVRSFGSSFLEEAFGGLVRGGVPKVKVKAHLRVISQSQGSARYLEAIDRYIDKA